MAYSHKHVVFSVPSSNMAKNLQQPREVEDEKVGNPLYLEQSIYFMICYVRMNSIDPKLV